MARRHPILQLAVWTSLLLAAPTARAEETWCSNDEALPADCFPDVLCPQYANYLDYRRAVVHIYGPDIGGTGVLINNVGCKNPEGGDADCGAPYLLTVAHLLTDDVMGDEITQGDIYAIENEATLPSASRPCSAVTTPPIVMSSRSAVRRFSAGQRRKI